ncbi:NAD(P)/FAD-dependent oxidoreductase [Sorangium sp. So ce119]|uniref:phytoene desaturase family protein n=1 Tax=Sorangium sp. So ce119 TaxID=3133279 RepID=UPI003F6449EE
MTPASPGARRGADADVLVIGAGFGGLGAALSLAERGAKVVLCEALRYPGGCASTFERGGYRFESGATLFSGLAPEQLFGRWIARHGLDVAVDWIDPLVELRTPSLRLAIGRDRGALVDALAGLPGAPARGIRGFFAYQARIADTLWALFDDPALLPPLGVRALVRHAASTPRYAALLPVLGRPLESVLARFGVAGFAPLRQYLDGLCQITVQCGVAEAEAPFAMATMDYYFRGTGHVRGGIGALAWALVRAVERLGGEARMASRVRSLEPVPGGFRAATRSGEIRARHVIANLLPQDLRALLGAAPGALPRLDRLARDVEGGWGAAMLYLVARAPEGASAAAHHLELVQDPRAPFTEGNHLFVSVSGAADEGRAPPGHRTLTVSTHVPLAKLRAIPPAQQGEAIGAIQARMREGLAALAPEWSENIVHALTASPRTFARFTGRAGGAVGGVPRRAGLGHYLSVWPRPVQDGLWMVGDSVFPGQSTLATAVGGVRTAESVARRLGLAPGGG